MTRARNIIVASGLLAFAAAGLAFPFYMASSKSKPMIDSSKPLSPQATFRGPYINTGSRDIGPDHQTYSKKAAVEKPPDYFPFVESTCNSPCPWRHQG